MSFPVLRGHDEIQRMSHRGRGGVPGQLLSARLQKQITPSASATTIAGSDASVMPVSLGGPRSGWLGYFGCLADGGTLERQPNHRQVCNV